MTRIPVAMAGLALVAVTAVACGSDDGDDDPRATDPTASSTSQHLAVASDSPSESSSPTASRDDLSGDPVPSPIINKAVKAAIADGFPALVPAGVPAGWTVLQAAYAPQGRRRVDHRAHRPERRARDPRAVDRGSARLVAQLRRPDAPSRPARSDLSGTGKWAAYTGTGDRRPRQGALRHRRRRRRPRPGHRRRPWPRSCSPPRTPAATTAAERSTRQTDAHRRRSVDHCPRPAAISRLPRTGRRRGRDRARPWSPGGAQ